MTEEEYIDLCKSIGLCDEDIESLLKNRVSDSSQLSEEQFNNLSEKDRIAYIVLVEDR